MSSHHTFRPLITVVLSFVISFIAFCEATAKPTNTPFFYYYTDGVAFFSRILGVSTNPDEPYFSGGEVKGDYSRGYWITTQKTEKGKWDSEYVVTGSMVGNKLPFYVHKGDRVVGVDERGMVDLIFLDSVGQVRGYISKIPVNNYEQQLMEGLHWLFCGTYRDSKTGGSWVVNPTYLKIDDNQTNISEWKEDVEADGLGLVRLCLSDGRSLLMQQTLEGKDVFEAIAPKDSLGSYRYGKLLAHLVQTDDENMAPGDTLGGRFRFTAYWMPFMRTMLRYFNLEQLSLMRAEYLARLGATFSDPKLQAYFKKKSWYVGKYRPDHIALTLQQEQMLAEMDCLIRYKDATSSSSPSESLQRFP